jgi:hypothetical protein
VIGGGEGAPQAKDLVRAFDLAGVYWALKNVLADVRLGTRRFEAHGRKVRFPYQGDAELEALDRLLETVDGIASMPKGPPPEFADLRDWERTAGRHSTWEALPLQMREEVRALARSGIAGQESYLDRALDVGGFTMGEAERVIVELHARALHTQSQIMLGSTRRAVVLPVLPRRTLIHLLAMATAVPVERVSAIVDLLTVDLSVCDDPCLTPLVPLSGERLAPLSSLITPGAQLRNFTARLQKDPVRFGKAGKLLGLLGSQTVAATLRGRLVGAKVAERVKVFHPNGRQAGDFDVVALDPATGEMAIFEVVWGISLDGSAAIADLEQRAHRKREQVKQLRAAILSGAVPTWPPGWQTPSELRVHWFVLTSNLLPSLLHDEGGIPIRSHRVLAGMRWPGTTVADMAAALRDPPLPPPPLSSTTWTRARFGRYEISVEGLIA